MCWLAPTNAISHFRAGQTEALAFDAEGSDLEGVVNQAVRQIAAAVESDKRSWSRTLNPSSDRLLLVTSSDSPATIRTHLRNVLQRMDGLHPEQTVMDAAKNQGEKDA